MKRSDYQIPKGDTLKMRSELSPLILGQARNPLRNPVRLLRIQKSVRNAIRHSALQILGQAREAGAVGGLDGHRRLAGGRESKRLLCATLHYTLHRITSPHLTSPHITLHYITLHCITLPYITLHCIKLQYTLHYIVVVSHAMSMRAHSTHTVHYSIV